MLSLTLLLFVTSDTKALSYFCLRDDTLIQYGGQFYIFHIVS
jgi:hypothetical protein